MSNETTQPTPGPWKYEDTEEIVSTSVEHFLGGPLVIATVMVQGDMQEYEWAANGRLMASAPALRDERDAYREALFHIEAKCGPKRSKVAHLWKCRCRPNSPSRTIADIDHAPGCVYVIARDVLARFAKEE